jgi:hypothetical protein
MTNLRSLAVENCTSIETSAPAAPLPLIALEGLTVDAFQVCIEISRPWTTILSFLSLVDLEFSMQVDEEVALWQDLLKSAPLLATISIRKLQSHPTSLDLRNQRVLETLHIRAPLFTHDMIDERPGPTIPTRNPLASTRSTKLSVVEIRFEHPGQMRMSSDIHWANLKRVVESPAVTWATLPKFVVTIQMIANWRNDIQERIVVGFKRRGDEVGADWLHVNIEKPLVHHRRGHG